MSEIIFARPDHDYGSYRDLWRLVELSGFTLITIGDIQADSDNVYVFSTPSTFWHDGVERTGWQGAKARIIYWGIEWYLDVDYNHIPGVEVWSADAWHAERVGVRYVPMGGHSGLNTDPAPADKVYDAITLWAASYNRYVAIGKMTEASVNIAPNGWGDERHNLLKQSRCMVYAHQYPDKPTIAPQRMALAAAYHLPVISEKVGNAGVFTNGLKIEAEMDDLGRTVYDWTRPNVNGKLSAYGERLRQFLCEDYTFRKAIEGAL